jgi:hypothetical protein
MPSNGATTFAFDHNRLNARATLPTYVSSLTTWRAVAGRIHHHPLALQSSPMRTATLAGGARVSTTKRTDTPFT